MAAICSTMGRWILFLAHINFELQPPLPPSAAPQHREPAPRFVFNGKHIQCDGHLPRAGRARKCLDELVWKIEWKHHFQQQASEMLPFRVPYQRTAVFDQLPCPSLRTWIDHSKSAVFSVLQEDRSRGKGSTAHVNTFPMIRLVWRRMRDGVWTLLPNDKGQGFCSIRHSETRDTSISSLVPGSYAETHFD